MLTLRFDPDCVTASLTGRCSYECADAIERALTYVVPGAFHTPQYKRGLWDGKKCLLKRHDRALVFPAGLALRVRRVIESFDFDLNVDDQRPESKYVVEDVDSCLVDGTHLYPDQYDALCRIIEEHRGCVVMPTGAGKTEVAAALAQHVKPDRVLVICDRTALMSQTAQRIQKRLIERVGRIGGGYRETDCRVSCATIQSLHTHQRKFTSFFSGQKAVIIDEAHTITDQTWFHVLKLIPAPVRLGLSATIKEASRRLVVEAYLGPIIYESGVDALIESGRAAEPRISILPVGGIVDSSVSDHEYAYTRGIVRNAARNDLIVDAVLKAAKRDLPSLVLVVRLDHGRQLVKRLADWNLHIPFLSGETPLDEIEKAKRDLADGTIPAIIASTIFDFGQNIPEIRALILAGGMRSPLRTIQRVGRSLRAKARDNATHILDFMDLGHGMLTSQSRERADTYRRKYGKVRVRQIASLDEWLA